MDLLQRSGRVQMIAKFYHKFKQFWEIYMDWGCGRILFFLCFFFGKNLQIKLQIGLRRFSYYVQYFVEMVLLYDVI